MNKILGFFAGALCGAVVGAATTLLLTPASGDDLRTRTINHWENAKSEARQAQADTRRNMEGKFENLRSGQL
jgi:gas vesicle protein